MNGDWQDVVALSAVFLAAAYIVRRFAPWPSRSRKPTGGCASGCGSCPLGGKTDPAGAGTVRPVQIGGLPRKP